MRNRTFLGLMLSLALGFVLWSGNAATQTEATTLPPERAPDTSQPPALPAAPLDVPTIYVTDTAIVSSLFLRDSMLYWMLGDLNCPGGEFAYPCIIHSKPTSGGLQRTLHNNTAGPSIYSNLVADSFYVYWVNTNGQIVRLPWSATPSTVPTVLSTREVATKTGEIAVDSTYVYWTENVDAFTQTLRTGKLFRAPKAGGSREPMRSISESTIRQMKADGLGGVLYISTDCGFFCFPDVLHRITYSGAFVVDYTSVNVQSYAFNNSTVYWATNSGASNLHLESAPLNNLATVTQGPDLTDGSTVPHMAIDANNLYWQLQTGGVGPIFRLSLASFSSGTPSAITINLLPTNGLVSNGRNLFWTISEFIYKLDVNAASSSLDLAIDDFEITQGIQNLTNTVPLVQNKWALARVYPRFVSGSPSTAMPSTILLHGTRGGSPLPGSPLRQVINVNPAGHLRENFADSANFILPYTWLNGSVAFRAEVINTLLFDPNTINNSKAVTLTFTPKSNICIKFLPLVTWEAPEYTTNNRLTGRSTPGFYDIVRRFSTLWPTPEVRHYTQYLGLRKPAFLSPAGPFTLFNAADKDSVIFALWEHNLYDNAPGWCGGNNARTHYVAMVNPAINTGSTLGYGALWDVLSFVKMLPGGSANFETPLGGAIMAQEVGHNHNSPFGDRWRHVGCNTPAGEDIHEAYPYPTNTIGFTGTRNSWGFDRMTNTPIKPDQASDYMSYCDPVWTSDYNWIGIMNATNSPRVLEPLAPNADTLTALGLVNHTETQASFALVYRTPQGFAREQARLAQPQHGGHAPVGNFALEQLSASNSVLATQPVTPIIGTHGEDFTFQGAMSYAAGATAIRLTRNGVEMARRAISANAPVVNITQPTGGSNVSNPLNISWTASDADGDPLTYMLQYSPNDGATWQTIINSYNDTSFTLPDTSDLPGSVLARVRVIANDGANIGTATSALFTLQGHAPRAYIDAPSDRAVFLAHETVVLEGKAYDMEEGALGDPALQWQVTGQVTVTGSSKQFSVSNLPPGAYTARLRATDSLNQSDNVTTTFTVSPKRVYDASAPVVDGFCNDSAYNSDLEPLVIRYSNGEVAQVRFVHANSALYVCFTGLRVGASVPGDFVGLKVDVDNSANNLTQISDRVFHLGRSGVAATAQGNGVGGETFDAVPQGFTGAVSENGGYWHAEMRIDEARLGNWNHFARMAVGHFWYGFQGDDYMWPLQSVWNSPRTWGLIALGKQPQTILFPALGDRVLGDLPFFAHATASSGLPISYTSSTPTICSVDGNVVVTLNAGLCTLVAMQGGNSSYNAATNVTQSFAILGNGRNVYLPLVVR